MEKLADVQESAYICTCVFHSIRFKVNKVVRVTAVTLFCF